MPDQFKWRQPLKYVSIARKSDNQNLDRLLMKRFCPNKMALLLMKSKGLIFSHSEYPSHMLMFLMTALLLICGAIDARGGDHSPIGIVTVDEVAVRSNPVSRGLLQKTLKRGTEFKIIAHRGGLLKIFHNDEVGFIRAQDSYEKITSGKKTETVEEPSKHRGDQLSQIDVLTKRKKTIRREIERGRKDVAAYTRREKEIIQHLQQVDLALNTSRKRTADLKREIEKLEDRIDEVSAGSKELIERIQANEEYVAKRLVALYKMSRLGKFHLLVSADTINEFNQRNVALERILAYDEKIQQDLVKNQVELKKMLRSLDDHIALRSTHVSEFQKQTRMMSQERSTRTKLLADIRKQKSLELAAIDALIQAADDLGHKIKLLSRKKNKDVPDKNASRLSFTAHKGLLIMPVKGKIINLFGPYKNPKYNITNFRSGIEIKADHGEPIRSVFKGKVIFSDWFKGYGNMIIIDHGNNYYTVYAHMEETFKSKGDAVDAGDVIATVGDTGSMTGSKLYFEVRHHGKPMNPLKWLKKG